MVFCWLASYPSPLFGARLKIPVTVFVVALVVVTSFLGSSDQRDAVLTRFFLPGVGGSAITAPMLTEVCGDPFLFALEAMSFVSGLPFALFPLSCEAPGEGFSLLKLMDSLTKLSNFSSCALVLKLQVSVTHVTAALFLGVQVIGGHVFLIREGAYPLYSVRFTPVVFANASRS